MSSKALKDLEKRLKSEPHNVGLKVTLAGMLREVGRSSEAVELYRSVALAYRDQGRKQQAIAVCRSILEIAPDDVACSALLFELVGPRTSSGSMPSLTPAPAAAPPPPQSSSSARPTQPPGARPTQPPGARATQPPGTRSAQSGPASRPPFRPSPSPGPPSRPPIQIPPLEPSRTKSQPIRPVTDVGTPPPAASRAPTAAPPPPVTAGRLPLEAPARRSSGQTTNPDVGRRSSGEVTPLPRPVPHHVYDPTARNRRVDVDDLDTNPDAQRTAHRPHTPSNAGLAEAARKITGLIAPENDVANPMDTRPVRRIKSEDLKKLSRPPPTGEVVRLSEEDIETRPQDAATKPGSPPEDDELTTPRDLLDPDD